MRVLVTGGAGYLGSVLCEHLLEAGYRVRALDSLLYNQSSLFHVCAHERFDFVRGDVRDGTLMRREIAKADVIVPLAAIVGAAACERDPDSARSVNYESIQMLNKIRSRDQIVVFPVTNSGYGATSGQVYCTEETPLAPISLYGRTKVDAEAELLSGEGLTVTLRLATVFGMSPRMRMDLLLNHFVYEAITKGYLVIFEKEFKRNFVHIRDVADAVLYSVRHASAMSGRAYNCGLDDANLSKEELAERIRRYVPAFYLHFAEIGADPDRRNYVVSNQRLRVAGFEARRSLDVGIQELLKGYRMMSRGMYANA